jgi:hypothetical protein
MRTIKSTKLASLALAFAITLAILVSGVASAQADSPWWHLSAGARPSYLRAGAARPEIPGVDEKQRVTVSGAPAELWSLGNMTKEQVEKPETECPSGEVRFAVFEVGAPASAVREGLETPCIYGAGNVEVVGTPSSEPTEYEVTFKGHLAEKPAPLMNTEIATIFFGSAVVATVTESAAPQAGSPPIADGEVYVTAENLGDANVSGASQKLQLTDVVPKGLKVIAIAASKPSTDGTFSDRGAIPCTHEEANEVTSVTCTTNEAVAPYDQLEMRIGVNVEAPSPRELQTVASVSGGGTQPVSVTQPLPVSEAPVPYGVEHYELAVEEDGGAAAVQAGVHPFQMTTTIGFNELRDVHAFGLHELASPAETGAIVSTPALTKDVNVKLPAGLIGNPTPIPQCSTTQFFQTNINGDTEDNACPADTAVGVADITIDEPVTIRTATFAMPIFNLEPRVGEPARFGFYPVAANSPVFIDTKVRTGTDYGVTAEVSNVTQLASFLSSDVTFWGVPGDARHAHQRGWGCLDEVRNLPKHSPCTPAGQQHPAPFLVLPTACSSPLLSEMETDSWEHPGDFLNTTDVLAPERALSGCNRLQFAPEVNVAPDGQEASKPTGLTVDVHVPQEVNENAEGFASSNVKDITVAFPEGVVVNPASADGLQACGEEEVGLQPGVGAQGEFLFTPTLPEPFCPDASKIGTVTIKSPLLPKGQNVEGSLYLATPAPNGEPGKNPFNTLIASYIIAKDPVSGTLVKLPGSVSLDGTTGRLTATFENNPQLAFEDAEIHLFGGERAPLATPSLCRRPGEPGYRTEATFTPWSGTGAVKSSSEFFITSGPAGPCPNATGVQTPTVLPFKPSLTAGSPNLSAGAFSPLTTTISREDGNQSINKVQLHFAPGMSGILSGIPLCHEAEANAGTCPESSLIGKTIVSVGLGGDPFSVTGGKVYLTEHYEGAPFGLSIVNPAVAGPFDLGKVIVRARIEVDQNTAALTVTTGEIPHILDGIPLQIKHVNVTIDRNGFTFNPTNCDAMSIGGSVGAFEGASSLVSVPFQVTNCAALKFAPKFAVSTSGKTSKANGASLHVKLTYPYGPQGTFANIAKVKVELPKALPSRLTTLQKACTAAQFEANPADCPSPSVIGHAKAIVPNIPVPLEGPVYFVSHGGEAFPSLEIVLQGYGVKIVLVGSTFISKTGVTSTTFKAIPDNPVSSFELTLPEGKYSALAANGNLCTQKLTMPTEFVGQNGTKTNQNTKVSTTGCAKAKPLTRVQKLKAALKACHKDRSKSKKTKCETTARKRFGPIKRSKSKTGAKGKRK